MRLVERHVIKRADPRFTPIDRAAFASKNLYNAALYVTRQAFIHQQRVIAYPELAREMKTTEPYRALPRKVSQWVLKQVCLAWTSYCAACATYTADPSRFLGHPRLPRYLDKQHGRNLLVYTTQALSQPGLRAGRVEPSGLGIQVRITEESYTSKASFLDADPLPVYGAEDIPAFSGRRVKRGLYRAADGRPINADVNGSYNIIRKGAPEAFAQGSRGCVVHPTRLAV